MLHPSLIERITRSLAYMLRHQPEQFDLELDEYGFADLGDVVAALNERLGEPVEVDDVARSVEGGERPRYEVRDGKIRALYGHSIQVKPGEPAKPPAVLYVGISTADAERARRYGLRPGRRTFLHLALTPEEALETGRRTSRDYVVITVNAVDAWEEGINFYDRKALFLSGPIPTQFLQVGDVQTDGYGDEQGFERGGRPSHGEDRPRSDRPDRADRSDRSEAPRRREWRDRPVDRPAERPMERPMDRPMDRPLERSAERPREPRPEPVGEMRGEHRGPRGRDRHGRGEFRGERRPAPPREERPHDRPEDRPADRPQERPQERSHERFERRGPPPERHESRERHDSRRGGPPPQRERFGDPPPRPSRPPEPARAEERPSPPRPSSSDSFGLGIFEAKPAEASSAGRARESRPREEPEREAPRRPASEAPREPARSESEDSGFGAGI